MANKPNNPSLWSRAKSMAKQKFDVYPSAYANGWAAKWYKSKGGTWRKAAYGMEVMGDGGTPDNPGFRALPPSVQQKIINNMAKGGEKMPPEIARARFAAAGNLDKMSDYGYAYGGYTPQMMYGGKQYMQQGGEQEQVMQIIQMFAQMNQMDPNELMQRLQQLQPEEQQQAIMEMAQVIQQASAQQQPDMTQAAMAFGGYTTGIFAEGGEPNGGMALGQMTAVADKMSKLRQFVSPEQNLDPWIASKLATMDESADAISDYMMYNPEFQEDMMEEDYDEEEMMMQEMRNGGYTVTRSNDRKGKTHKVTGPDGTVKYFGDSKLGQHPKDPERKKAFYARHKKNLANNPYFRAFARETWKEGGSTFSGNAFYQVGGQKVAQDNTYTNNAAKAKADYEGYMAVQKNASVANPLFENPYSVLAFPDLESSFPGDSVRMFPGQTAFGKTPYILDLGMRAGVLPKLSNAEMAKLVNSGKVRSYSDSTYMNANPDFLSIRPKKQDGGAFIPEYDMAFPADYAVEMMKQGGIFIDPAKKGTFKAQATRMGMGVQEAASAILKAPKGKHSPAMRKKANFAKNFAKQMGGPVEGEVLDVTPEELEMLRQQGYEFEMM